MEKTSNGNSEPPIIVNVNKAKSIIKRLQVDMKDAAPEDLNDEGLLNLRRRLVYECEKIFKDDEWRPKLYQSLWMNAFYSTIFVYRGAWKLNQGLKSNEKEAYKTFCDKTELYLLRLVKKYPDLAYSIYNSIGDIHRYSAEILNDTTDIKEAVKYYGRSVKAKPEQGHSFNQLGLLLRSESPWKAIIMFLRAGIMGEPYIKAFENLRLIKSDDFDNLRRVALEYVNEMFNPFNRVLLEASKNKWIESLTTALEEKNPNYQAILTAFTPVVLGSLGSMSVDKGSDERQRYLINVVADDFKLMFKEFGDVERSSPAEDRMRRRFREVRARRKARDDENEEGFDEEEYSDDDDKDGSDVDENVESNDDESAEDDDDSDNESVDNSLDHMLPLLALLIEWYNFIDSNLMEKRPSVALRITLQTLSQLIMDNANKYIDHIQVSVNEDSSANVLWMLKAPGLSLRESFYYELIPLLLKSAETWTSFPICFDRYYKLLGKSQDLSTMREMARLQLEHAATDDTVTTLPTHYLLEAEVIRTRLYFVKTLVTDKANILVAKSTMRKFDRLKAKDPDARTAIRFLEDKTKAGEIKILPYEYDRSLAVAQAFLSSLENREGINILILMLRNEPNQKSAESIHREGVDKFLARYTAMKRRI